MISFHVPCKGVHGEGKHKMLKNLVKKEWQCLLNACQNENFQNKLRGFLEIKKINESEMSYDIAVKYNLAQYIAYDIACNVHAHEDIEEIFNKYPICEKNRSCSCLSADTWITNIVPLKFLDIFYKTVSIIEVFVEKKFQEKGSLPYCWLDKVKHKKLQNVNFTLGLYQTSNELAYIDGNLQKKEIEEAFIRVLMKHNKKLWNQYRYDKEFDAGEFLFQLTEREKNSIKPACKYAVLAYLSSVIEDASIDVFAENSPCSLAAIQITLNNVIEDFALQAQISGDYNITKEQKKIVEDIFENRSRNVFSQLFVSNQEHVDKYISDPDHNNTGKKLEEYICKARNAYEGICNSAYNEEEFNKYLPGAVYIQILLDAMQTYNLKYREVIENSQKLKDALVNAEKKCCKLSLKEKEVALKEKSFLKEKDRLLLFIEELQHENAILKKSLVKAQEVEKKHRDELKTLSEKLDAALSSKSTFLESTNYTEIEPWKLESMERLKICFIGGHPNFTKKLRERFGNWKYISEKQSNFPLNIFNGCDIVFQADAHCNHALSDRRDRAIGNTKIPIVYLNNVTNIDICIRKMICECEERGMLC